jgi:hypothetical protein
MPARCVRSAAADTASNATRLAAEDPAGLGQRDRAAGPLEQGDAQPAFQLPDRLGQCGLRDAQPGRGAAEMKFVGHRQEVRQFPSLERPEHLISA